MKSPFRKIAYFVVLIAMVLLVGERSVPHHHCGEGTVCCTHQPAAIHFGYGECEECEHGNCGHGHNSTEEHCCDDSLLYFRMPGNDTQVEKKYVAFNVSCFLVPEETLSHAVHVCSNHQCFLRLVIPDIGIPNKSLRAPPIA